MIQKASPWFIHKRKLATVIGDLPSELLNYNDRSVTSGDVRLADFVFEWIRDQKIEPLGVLMAEDRLAVGSLFTIYRDFLVRTVPHSTNRAMHVRLVNGTELFMELGPTHYTSASSASRLGGHPTNLFVFAYVMELAPSRLVAAPLLIADLVEGSPHILQAVRLEVPVYSIENFVGVDWSPSVTEKQLEALKFVPEKDVKTLFARIFGEPVVPADWGGEMNDLFTTRIAIAGEYVATAIAFKGPAMFRELTPSRMGKNGDQIGRLFNSPADFCVVQHCNRVHLSVRHQMRDYANRNYSPKRYCIIDGYQTYLILRHYAPEYLTQ